MLSLLLALSHPAAAVVGSEGAYQADALAHAQDFDAVGLLDGSDCVAVLVAPRVAVTLASCADAASADEVRFGDGSALDRRGVVERVVRAEDAAAAELADLAVLHLTSSIADVEPIAISLREPLGERGRIVGFGPWGTADTWPTGTTGAGVRHAVDNAIDDDDPDLGLRVDFDAPDGTANSLWLQDGVQSGATGVPDEGIAGPADEGAALLVETEGGWRLVGLFLAVDNGDDEPGGLGSIARFLPLAAHETLLDAEGALWDAGDSASPDLDTGDDGDDVRTGWAGGPARCAAAPAGAGLLALFLSAAALLRRRES